MDMTTFSLAKHDPDLLDLIKPRETVFERTQNTCRVGD